MINIWDFLFPTTCPSCGREVYMGSSWCQSCLQKVSLGKEVQIENGRYVKEVFVLAQYVDGVRNVLRDVKFNDKKEVQEKVLPFFAALEKWDYLKEVQLVIPVPISRKKREERRYNQVDILFKDFFLERGLLYKDCLAKLSHTKPMWGLMKKKRYYNVYGAYILREELLSNNYIYGKNVLIVDDILTTGSTIEEVGRILNKSGAKKIKALTFASGALT